MAAHCDRLPIRPALVLCSSAARARETIAGVLPGLGAPLRVEIEDDLYTFEARTLLDRIRGVDDGVPSLMIVAHNPGIAVLAGRLAGSGDDLLRLQAKFPTCALATIDLDVDGWSDVAHGSGHLDAFVTPADLTSRRREA